jgi:SAM-dependent methyltransferase
MSTDSYLLTGKDRELERLQRGSRMLEPAGRRLLAEIGDGQGVRALDVGCGALGWLRLLSEWVGPDGQVVGTDIQDEMLAAAQQFVTVEGLGNVTLVNDDLFASQLEPASFDLVHARALIFPLGRGPEQMATHLRLVRPGGTVVLEEVDTTSLHHLPPAPAFDRLKPLVIEAFRKAGGDPDAAATQLELFRSAEIDPNLRAEIRALPPGDPALQEPLQYLTALDGLLRSLVDPRSWNGSARRPSASSRIPAAGDSTSHWCRSGASVGPSTLSLRIAHEGLAAGRGRDCIHSGPTLPGLRHRAAAGRAPGRTPSAPA